MTPQPAISSIPQHTEVGGEFTSHNLAPDGLPDAFGVQSVLKSIRGAKGQHRSQRRRCGRFECGPPDPHSLAALFERYDDRDGWRKNRPRGCTLQRRRKATGSDCIRVSVIRVHVWVRERVLARVWRGGWVAAWARIWGWRRGGWAVRVLRLSAQAGGTEHVRPGRGGCGRNPTTIIPSLPRGSASCPKGLGRGIIYAFSINWRRNANTVFMVSPRLTPHACRYQIPDERRPRPARQGSARPQRRVAGTTAGFHRSDRPPCRAGASPPAP